MDKEIELWLHDMLAAIDEVFDFLPEPRNFHVYDTVSSSIIWAIAVRELPKLREEIVGLLEI